jgi:hypothetical protein
MYCIVLYLKIQYNTIQNTIHFKEKMLKGFIINKKVNL